MNKLPNMLFIVLGAVLLAISLSLISVVYWIASNLLTILVTLGCVVIVLFFTATTYSYYHGIKSIKRNFHFEEQEKLCLSLKHKTIATAVKVIIAMFIYSILWGIIIYFVNTQIL